MRGRPAERYTTIREFGAVGNGLCYALGVAAARRQGRDGKIVLFEGNGGFLFHIQELETLKRQGFRILMCVMNDGGYGSEFHKLRADGVDDRWALFGRPAFEKIAQRLRPARQRDSRCVGHPEAVRRLHRAGRKRNLEHPDLRPGHGAGDARRPSSAGTGM